VTHESFAECWSLDPTGNWKKYLEDGNGDGTWDLNQARTSNEANEITDITESTGPSWVTPAYSKAGNMTTMPQPADPTNSYAATYDAWNRLVKLVDGANTVAEYEYDGAKRRIIHTRYDAGTLTHTSHLYYTEPNKWQIIEERVDTSPTAEQQYVWGLRYIDDIVLRDRDTTINGTMDERYYGLQDANWNVTALSSVVGSVQERFAFSGYGTPKYLKPDFSEQPTSGSQWTLLFSGYHWEPDAGFYDVRNRVFHAEIGSWLQRDTLSYLAGVIFMRTPFCQQRNMSTPPGMMFKLKTLIILYHLDTTNAYASPLTTVVAGQTANIAYRLLGAAHEEYQRTLMTLPHQGQRALLG